MHMLDLPPEIVHRILFFAVLSRGVTRALRMKLVCRAFREAVQPALFETRLLDEPVGESSVGFRPRTTAEHRIRKSYGADELWLSYLRYRVRNETHASVGRYVEIRQVAEELCRQTGTEAEYETTIDTLCWLALEWASEGPGLYRHWHDSANEVMPKPHINLLCTAAYLGHFSLVTRLVQQNGYSPLEDNYLFPSAMHLAALACNLDMIRLFRELHVVSDWDEASSGSCIYGAVESGNMEVVRLAAEPLVRAIGGTCEKTAKAAVEALRGASLHATKWEVWRYIRSVVPEEAKNYSAVDRFAGFGNVEMLRGLIEEEGEWFDGPDDITYYPDSWPLINAAYFYHEDAVDLLLKHGADVHRGRGCRRMSALAAAAAAGSLPIVRKLLDHRDYLDTSVDELYRLPLRFAVTTEHVAMLDLLLERDTVHVKERSHYLLDVAKKRGLDSMVEYIEARVRASES